MWHRASYLFLGLSLTACAAATSSNGRRIGSATGRDVITAAEIVASRVSDAYQAVSQLRPDFLRRRAAWPAPTFAPVRVAVYLDGMLYGGAESLRQIPLDRVRLIRYISSFDADLRWGGSHPAGAILVTTLAPR